jgi:hypothetical protein
MSNGSAHDHWSARIVPFTTLQPLLVDIPWIYNPPASIPLATIQPARTLLESMFGRLCIGSRKSYWPPFPFFHLPREIRDLVYDWVFFDSKFIICHINMIVKVSYDIHSTVPRERFWPPPWMLVSKQFFSEGVVRIHSNGCFVFNTDSWLEQSPRSAGSLRPDRARSVCLIDSEQCCIRPRRTQISSPSAWSIHAGGPKLAALEQAIIHLQHSTALQELRMHIRFDFPNPEAVVLHNSDTFPWREQFDIVPFGTLFNRLPRNLQHVVISTTTVASMDCPAIERAFQAVCFCLLDVAMMLVEFKGHECFAPLVIFQEQDTALWRKNIEVTSAAFRRRQMIRF